MNKGRLEAFSDGVLAVIITVMVLEMKSPPQTSPVRPWLSDVCYIFVAITWLVPDRRIERKVGP